MSFYLLSIELVAPAINNFKDMTVSQDVKRNLRLLCNATGNPTPTILWRHGDKSLSDAPLIDNINRCKNLRRGIYRVKKQDNVLIFCRLNYKEHAGVYSCRATNSLSWVLDEMTLTVTGKNNFPLLSSLHVCLKNHCFFILRFIAR